MNNYNNIIQIGAHAFIVPTHIPPIFKKVAKTLNNHLANDTDKGLTRAREVILCDEVRTSELKHTYSIRVAHLTDRGRLDRYPGLKETYLKVKDTQASSLMACSIDFGKSSFTILSDTKSQEIHSIFMKGCLDATGRMFRLRKRGSPNIRKVSEEFGEDQ